MFKHGNYRDHHDHGAATLPFIDPWCNDPIKRTENTHVPTPKLIVVAMPMV